MRQKKTRLCKESRKIEGDFHMIKQTVIGRVWVWMECWYLWFQVLWPRKIPHTHTCTDNQKRFRKWTIRMSTKTAPMSMQTWRRWKKTNAGWDEWVGEYTQRRDFQLSFCFLIISRHSFVLCLNSDASDLTRRGKGKFWQHFLFSLRCILSS